VTVTGAVTFGDMEMFIQRQLAQISQCVDHELL